MRVRESEKDQENNGPMAFRNEPSGFAGFLLDDSISRKIEKHRCCTVQEYGQNTKQQL